MSLIHDALKSMDAEAPQQSRPAPAGRASIAMERGRPAWLDGLLAFCVVVAAGAVGWYLWQGRARPAPSPAPAVALAAPAAPAATMPAPAPLGDAPAPMPAPAGAPPAADGAAPGTAMPMSTPMPGAPDQAQAQVQAPAQPAQAAAATARTPAAAQDAPGAAPAAAAATGHAQHRAHRTAPRRHARTAQRAAAPVPAPAPAVDDTPVELHFAKFVTAMRGGQTDDAERELATLKARLPADSLGMLRAQAWFDLKAGRDVPAADAYRKILDRMPGDEEAAINLASIQSRQLKHEDARATLDAAARLHPDSAALRAALAQYTPNARK